MGKLTVRELVLFAVLGSMTFAAKYVMSFLPNIEPVSLCVMLYAVVFGKKWVYPVYLYVLLEILFYGISLWNINYLYIWAVLGIAACCLRNMRGRLGWALLSGGFGLLFGGQERHGFGVAVGEPFDVGITVFAHADAGGNIRLRFADHIAVLSNVPGRFLHLELR